MAVTPLDRNSPMPLWAQLESDLRSRLEANEFADGFPTDLELTGSYSVSRHTVREAVRHLNQSGVLTRQRGRGTVINRAEFEQSLGTLYSLFQTIEASGVAQTSELLGLRVVTDPVAAMYLEVDEDTELVLLERLRLAGGEPLAVDRAWLRLPHAAAAGLLDVDWTRTALYDELAKIGAPVPNQGWERLSPMRPGAEDRASLSLRKRDAVFYLERLGSRDSQPIEYRTTLIRGDRYRFVTEWTAGGQTALRPSAA